MIQLAALQPWETRICGVVILLTATAFAIRFWRAFVEGLLSYRFVLSSAKVRRLGNGRLAYEYVVDGTANVGSTIGYFVIDPDLLEKLELLQASGDVLEMPVYFDPVKPNRSTLQKGISLPSWVWIGCWMFWLLVGFVLHFNIGEINQILYWSSGD